MLINIYLQFLHLKYYYLIRLPDVDKYLPPVSPAEVQLKDPDINLHVNPARKTLFKEFIISLAIFCKLISDSIGYFVCQFRDF